MMAELIQPFFYIYINKINFMKSLRQQLEERMETNSIINYNPRNIILPEKIRNATQIFFYYT